MYGQSFFKLSTCSVHLLCHLVQCICLGEVELRYCYSRCVGLGDNSICLAGEVGLDAWGTTFYLSNWEEEASSGRNLENRHEMYRNPLGTGSNVICLTLWTVPAADIAIKMQKTTWGHRILYIKQKREMLIWTLKPINARQYSQILPLPILFGSCCQTQSSPNSQLVGWKSRSVTSMRKLHLQWWGRQRAGTLWTRWRSSSAGRRPGSPCTPGQQKYFLSRTFISRHYYNSPPALHWISEVTK